ncbi:L,D-transpeptidase [Paracoccus tegillarcae]|uniref:L,D-transpeptidase n=1 Tax=Paracoccus tegillarcae TaxID=1529068 RepID=A0A2K9EHI5_9RHOB|nr:L,D-transpeptidase [Paracoccus tegillarcae]AUH32797.1 L,D-transpeptidase [Paracoccus tegillarcae]
MRFAVTAAALALGLAACAPETQESTVTPTQSQSPLAPGASPASESQVYGPRLDLLPGGETYTIPAVRQAYLTERNRRQRVAYNGSESAGTLVVDPFARVLYHVLGGGEAMRFGIAVGRQGKGFSGNATVQRKQAWPSWTPTANMIRTEPQLYAEFAGGVSGGPDNPLGSRALYLYRGGRDTYYRIHGTMDPSSIGKATSAGCIRLFNQDVMDLFDEMAIGARVHVRDQAESVRLEGPMINTPEGYVVPAREAQAATAAVPVTTVSAPVGQVSAPVSPVESAVPSR